MNKLLTTLGIAFFSIEAIGIMLFLSGISLDIEVLAPWIMAGAVNIAFLVVLFVGLLRKE